MWLNHPKLTRNCPIGLLPNGSKWLGEWSNHPEHSPVGLLFQEAKWLEEVWCTPNSLQIALSACFPLHLSGSRRFGVVKPSNHPELTRNCLVGLLTHASQWFEEVRWGRTTAL